ncbi:MAG: TRAP transporter small permease subunit [Rhodobacteraceae bacterium]|nr:TRAP transporter small permease subunit [Paracoccaceae bacterium]
MHALLRLADVIDWINERVGRVAMWLVLVMILVGFFNAVLRYGGRWIGINLTSNMSVEAQWYMFSLVFLLMAAYTLRRDQHVRVDVLYGRLSDRGRAWVNLLGGIFFLLPFCALIFYVSYPFVASSLRIREMSPDPGGLPRWPIKLMIPIAFGLLTLQGLSMVIRSAGTLAGHGSAFRDRNS